MTKFANTLETFPKYSILKKNWKKKEKKEKKPFLDF